MYNYDEVNKRYVEDNTLRGDGDGTAPVVKHELYKAVKNNDEIILYEKFAYIDVEWTKGEDANLKIYNDLNKNNLVDDIIDYHSVYGQYYTGYSTIKLSDYYEKLSMVKYTFKKGEDNSYYFNNSKIVNDF